MRFELPPTDGLPVRGRDLLAPRKDLAQTLATLLDIPNPALTCSGTAALVVALRVLHKRNPERHKVIVSAWSCPLVPLAANACPGIKFVLCDLKPNSLDIDPEQLAKLCDAEPPLAVVITHLAGRVSALHPAIEIAHRHGAMVIEDAAQALGARYKGQSLGLHGDIGFYSLAFGKGLTCCEGGVLFSRDPALQVELAAQTTNDLPFHPGWEIKRCIELLGYAALYKPKGLWWIYGMQMHKALSRENIVAAVGDDFTAQDIPLHRLGRWRQSVAASAAPCLPDYWQAGRRRAQNRCAVLQALPDITVLKDRKSEQGVWPMLLVLMPNESARDKVLNELWRAGLGVTRLFVHALADYPEVTPWISIPCKIQNARDIAARSLTITNSGWLEDSHFSQIVETIKRCLHQASTLD